MCGCSQASKPFCWAFGNTAGEEMLLLSAVCAGWRIVFLYLILNIKILHKTKADAWLGSRWLGIQSIWVLHAGIMQTANNSILTDTMCVHMWACRHKHTHAHINPTTAQLELASFKVSQNVRAYLAVPIFMYSLHWNPFLTGTPRTCRPVRHQC